MMKKTMTILLAGILACSVTACGNAAKINLASDSNNVQQKSVGINKGITSENDISENDASEKNTTIGNTSEDTTSQSSSNDSSDHKTSEPGETSDLFTERDLDQSPDLSSAKTIVVADGETIDITEEGIYVIQGTATDCFIRVEAEEQSKVQLVLDGVNITNSDHSAIYVVSADKCFITTTNSNNILSVTGEFAGDDTTGDAVIYSKDDLVLNGTGTLTINSSKGNGISGKDDLKITGGTYVITSAKDSIETNDSIAVYDGNFTIKTSKDGFHSEYSDDDTVGWIYIGGGTFDLTAASDAIQATTMAKIDGGTFDITAAEGIEATYIEVNDGTINITASDDGINAAQKSKSYSTPTVEINGGMLTIIMGQGDTDAIDANGNIIVNGGTIDITAQMSSFDYDGTAQYNGGTIIINGTQVDSIPQPAMGGRGGMGGMNGGDFGRRR